MNPDWSWPQLIIFHQIPIEPSGDPGDCRGSGEGDKNMMGYVIYDLYDTIRCAATRRVEGGREESHKHTQGRQQSVGFVGDRKRKH